MVAWMILTNQTDAALHPTAKEIGDYLSSYAHHFDLVPHIRFSTKVIGVERDDAAGKWVISTRNVASLSQETYTFDRLVVATGILNTKNQVSISGIERFKGEVVHSREFKDPYQYTGKNVLVVGIGATGSDTTSFLKRAGAANIYLSHRSQTYLVSALRRII